MRLRAVRKNSGGKGEGGVREMEITAVSKSLKESRKG